MKLINLLATLRRRWPEYLTAVLGSLWLGVFPFWHDGSYTRITRAKWIAMLVLAGVTVLAVLIGFIVLLLTRRKRLIKLHPVQGAVLIYLGWLGLSAIFGDFTDRLNNSGQLAVIWGAVRYEGLITQSIYGGIFLLMSFLPVNIRAVGRAAAGAMILYLLFVLAQYADLNPFGLFPSGRSVHNTPEFQGPIGNIDMVTGWVSLITPLLLGAYVFSAGSWVMLISGGCGVMLQLLLEVQSGLIVLAATMAALALIFLLMPTHRDRVLHGLALIFSLISLRLLIGLPWYDEVEHFSLLFARWKLLPLAAALGCIIWSFFLAKKPGRPMPLRLTAALAALAVIVVLAAVYLLPLPPGNGLWELQEILHGRAQDAFGSERLGVWRMTLDMSRDNLLFGTGPDGFYYAFQDYLARTGQSLMQTFDNPHNLFLAILSGSGLPALVIYLGFLVLLTYTAGKHIQHNPWLPAMLMGLGGYLIQGMFTFSICLVSPMFWAAMGLTLSLSTHQHNEVTDHDVQL